MSAPQVVLKERDCDPALMSADTELHPLLQRIFSARGIAAFSETRYDLKQLLPPARISQLAQAAAALAGHIEKRSRIIIFGDYDADGATSTALCLRALAQMGAAPVDFYLPDRIKDGYGLSENVAQRIVRKQPQLVITVDTGIASIRGIKRLTDAGIDVIVTDHHLPADELPADCIIVNPNAYADSAGKSLAGVGVAFYLMLALRAHLRDTGWFAERSEPNLADCLDVVAIGTVADLVPLDYTNRVLVNEGLKRLRAGACSAGIRKLIQVAGRAPARLSAQDIAFSLAPRINAAGRLDDMSIGVQTLLSDNDSEAEQLARELDSINSYRRELQGQMTGQALAMLPVLDNIEPRLSHVLFQPDWHEGIVGIIASKVKDQTFRPSISFALAEGGLLKGSARSIPGVHMRDMLDLVDKSDSTLIERFGGHAMAAGLSIRPEQLEPFRERFEWVMQQHADPNCFNNVVECDGEIEPHNLTMEVAQMLAEAGPWGQKFPLPSFHGRFNVVDQRVLADRHLKFVLKPQQGGQAIDAIMFYASDDELKTNYRKLRLHYELHINEFRGEQNLQLMIRHIL